MVRLPTLLTLCLVLVAAGPASGGLMTLRDSSVTLEVYGITLPDAIVIPLVVTQPQDATVLVSSGTGGFTLPPGVIVGSVSTFLPINSLLDKHTLITSNPTLTFSASGAPGGGFGGVGGLAGTWVAGVLGGIVNLTIPLSVVGAGGAAADAAGSLAITLTGYAGWTLGPVSFTGLSLQPSPPVSTITRLTRTGFDDRTTAHAGSIQLVTPIRVLVSGGSTLPGFVTLDLKFVPEPGTAALLALAAASVALLGQRRTRR